MVLNDIEKIHINRVKDNLMKALNYQTRVNTERVSSSNNHHLLQQASYNTYLEQQQQQ